MSSALAPLIRNASWQQTMLRVKDPVKSVAFYTQHFGLRLLDRYDFDDFSLYFLGLPRDGAATPEPGTPEAHDYLWNMSGTCLELTHNHGTENDDAFQYNNGMLHRSMDTPPASIGMSHSRARTQVTSSRTVASDTLPSTPTTCMRRALSWRPPASSSRSAPTRAA